MSKRNGHKNISFGAISPEAMDRLLHPSAPTPRAPSPEEIRTSQAAAAKALRIMEKGKEWKLCDGSAAYVVDNPWVEAWLSKIKNTLLNDAPKYESANARVSEITPAWRGSNGLRLKIRSSWDKRDVAVIEVTSSGDFRVDQEPRGAVLKKVLGQISPPKAARPAPRIENRRFGI